MSDCLFAHTTEITIQLKPFQKIFTGYILCKILKETSFLLLLTQYISFSMLFFHFRLP